MLIKGPPPLPGGGFFCFCTVSSAHGVAAAAHGRRLSYIPCHLDIYKTAFSIHLMFNILDTSNNS